MAQLHILVHAMLLDNLVEVAQDLWSRGIAESTLSVYVELGFGVSIF
jgi:hypothetical protein